MQSGFDLSVGLLLAAYFHYLALLLAAAILGVAFLRALHVKRGLRSVLVASAAFCLAYLPGFYALRRTVSWRISGWQHGGTVADLTGELLVRGFFGSAFRIGALVLVVAVVLELIRRTRARDKLLPLMMRPQFGSPRA